MQSTFFNAPKYSPNLTVTVFPGEAFILAYKILGNPAYLHAAKGAVEFVLKDLPVLYEDDNKKCLGYVPEGVKEKVININSMTVAFLSKLYRETKDEKYEMNAVKLVDFIAGNIIYDEKWTYTTDYEHSYVDNYHTVGIVDKILETMENLDYRYPNTSTLYQE